MTDLPVKCRTAAEIGRDIRYRLPSLLADDSATLTQGVAIYTLSDPRDIQQLRYVGQTASPRRRFLQHLNTARLWLPDELPWWVASPKLRPLYHWIRTLYGDDSRLPVMVIRAWVAPEDARAAERAQIFASLERKLPLLNVEAQTLGSQLLLL